MDIVIVDEGRNVLVINNHESYLNEVLGIMFIVRKDGFDKYFPSVLSIQSITFYRIVVLCVFYKRYRFSCLLQSKCGDQLY